MSREWQQTKLRQYVMPDAVYYQSIWAVRDLERMEGRLRELDADDRLNSRSILKEKGSVSLHGQPTEQLALERAILRERIDGIRDALSVVPTEYKSFILSNIILKTNGNKFPTKLWKLWKQRFLYGVAKNLSMM